MVGKLNKQADELEAAASREQKSTEQVRHAGGRQGVKVDLLER